MEKGFCEKCGKLTSHYSFKNVKEYFDIKGKKVEVVIEKAFCDKCGSEVSINSLTDDNLKKIHEEYCKMNGFLLPDEISNIRKLYNLKQSDFSKLLGFGAKTITRYENGSLQTRANDLAIRNFYNPYFVLNCLELQKEEFNETTYEEIYENILQYLIEHSIEQEEVYSKIKYSYSIKINDSIVKTMEEKLNEKRNKTNKIYS